MSIRTRSSTSQMNHVAPARRPEVSAQPVARATGHSGSSSFQPATRATVNLSGRAGGVPGFGHASQAAQDRTLTAASTCLNKGLITQDQFNDFTDGVACTKDVLFTMLDVKAGHPNDADVSALYDALIAQANEQGPLTTATGW